MIDNTANPQLSCLINDGEQWILTQNSQRCSYWVHGLQKLKTLLQSYYFKPQSMSMDLVQMAKHTCETEASIHYNECIHITNMFNHFETVKMM